MSWAQNTSVIKQTSSSYMLKQTHKIMHNSSERQHKVSLRTIWSQIFSHAQACEHARTHTHTHSLPLGLSLLFHRELIKQYQTETPVLHLRPKTSEKLTFTLPKKLLKAKGHTIWKVCLCVVCRDLILVRQWSHTNEWISQDHASYKLLLEISFENKHEFLDKTTIS